MTRKPKPMIIQLEPAAMEYRRLLGGPPETVTMRSGHVALPPGTSVGRHNTGAFEEMIIVLEGEGELLMGDGAGLPLNPYTVAYCPPQTEHDVRNTGSGHLRYVYVVARP